MDISIDTATQADFDEILRLDGVSFGFDYTAEHVERVRPLIELDRFLTASDGDRTVGVAGDYPFTMTVPGGATHDIAGVTWVSVAPGNRGRGILRAMMQFQLAAIAAKGLPMAALTATQSGLYGRYGYGVADFTRHTSIDRRATALLPAVAEQVRSEAASSSGVEVVTAERARVLLPELHRRWAASVPGALSRSEPWWDYVLADAPEHRHGASVLFHLVHPDGYLSYRVEDKWPDGLAAWNADITDYRVCSPAAHRALWDVMLSMDLVSTITSRQVPVDDPLPWLVTDSRQIRVSALTDGIWLRLIDIEQSLATRGYGVEVDAVIEVSDEQFGGGRFHLVAGPGGAECRRTDRTPSVSLDVADLGSTYLGGVRLQQLIAAGRVTVHDATLATRLDRALLTERAPDHGTHF